MKKVLSLARRPETWFILVAFLWDVFSSFPNFVEMPSLFLQNSIQIGSETQGRGNRTPVFLILYSSSHPWLTFYLEDLKIIFHIEMFYLLIFVGYSLKPPLQCWNIIWYSQVKTTYSLKTAFLLAQPKIQECFHLLPTKEKNDFMKYVSPLRNNIKNVNPELWEVTNGKFRCVHCPSSESQNLVKHICPLILAVNPVAECCRRAWIFISLGYLCILETP